MKKLLSAFLVVAMAAAMLVGCAGSGKDWDYIKGKKELVIGITYYEPMNYHDPDSGELTGFDTEFAQAVCKELGVEAKFQEIEWDQKEMELKSKTIDCIWNGLTVSEERKENMAFSKSYVENKQVVVIKKDNADKFASLESLTGIKICAESGSAGEDAIVEDATLSTNEYIDVSAQRDALLEVKSGTCDACVLDYVLAKAVINDDTDYSDLMIIDGIELAKEEYAIGFRLEDTETVEKVNAVIDKLLADGTLKALGEKYGVNVIE